MQLRDKFEQLEDFDEDKMVEIAENFAIGFLSWTNTYKDYGLKTNEQLLEIYKKTL